MRGEIFHTTSIDCSNTTGRTGRRLQVAVEIVQGQDLNIYGT